MTALLEYNPLPEKPPARIRAVLYRYRFADAVARRQGAWWTPERLGEYSPALSLAPGAVCPATIAAVRRTILTPLEPFFAATYHGGTRIHEDHGTGSDCCW